MRKSLWVSLVAVFGALHCVLYFVSFGLWRNWAIYVESIEGIILGPSAGFLAALVGSSIARMIRPDLFWMFGIVAEPVTVLLAGFLAAGKWKPSLAVYGVMLAAYFIHPFGRMLPLWTVMDLLAGLLIIYPAARLSGALFGTDLKRLPISLCLVSFVCSTTDSLVRVFLLIPCGFYTLFPGFFSTFEEISAIFVPAAFSSFIEDAVVVAVALIAGVPVMIATSKLRLPQQKNLFGEDD